MTNKRKIINDPVYGLLAIDDDILFDIISHPYFQRQRYIKQLGFTYLVYPGATHTRFSHMLGAMHLTTRAIEVLKGKGVSISDEEALGVKIAILLHDVGHGPFSHTSEYMLVNVPHEFCSSLFMKKLNAIHNGRLNTAIAIFENRYPRRFLHQLVSSQLDMDRLDYLSRDSFFSGVSEGIVGTDRIINMLNVKYDELVVDEKGIYSIEKFIISRRLMYWQVYLHKTVVAADMLLMNILGRVRELLEEGRNLAGNSDLKFFLSQRFSTGDFLCNDNLLERYAQIDDNDVMSSIKEWSRCDDTTLRRLSEALILRQLPAIKVSSAPFDNTMKEEKIQRVAQQYGISEKESCHFVGTGTHINHAYSFNDNEIKVLFKDGRCLDISQASDQLDRHFLEKTVKKYYIYYPKELS